MGPCLPASRVLALVGGLALLAAFFMPWFASQGLLLSGQFLHVFLASASAADLQRFLPGSNPTEVQLLRLLVDLLPASGAVAAVMSLVGRRFVVDLVLAVSGLVPLLAWSVGQTRLPSGSSPEIGLWLIPASSLAVCLAATLELLNHGRRGLRCPQPDSN